MRFKAAILEQQHRDWCFDDEERLQDDAARQRRIVKPTSWIVCWRPWWFVQRCLGFPLWAWRELLHQLRNMFRPWMDPNDTSDP